MSRVNLPMSIISLLVTTTLAACAADGATTPGADELAGENGADGESPKADAAHDNFGFIAVTQGPATDCTTEVTCARYELSRPNRSTMKCTDGQYHEQCSTHAMSWSRAGLTPAKIQKVEAAIARQAQEPSLGVQVLVKGGYTNDIDFLAFEPTEVWLAQRADGTASGTFVRIFDNKVRCITAPCPQFEEGRLNSSRTAATAGFDFDPDVSDALKDRVYGATGTADGVIVVGTRTRTRSGLTELLRTVNQIYLPMR